MATDNSLDGRNLKSTIFIDGEEYNVHAKTAESLIKNLTISVIQGTTTTDTVFDGSDARKATIIIPTKVSELANDVEYTHVDYADAAPKPNGTAAVGTSSKVAREDHVHPLQTTVSGNAGTATKLAAAKKISLTGHVTGEVSFDGSTAVNISTTVNPVTAGLQPKLTSGTNIKTINGYDLLGDGNITIGGGAADKIKVTMASGIEESTITVKSEDPSDGSVGDIWFKY